jgi:hypothetical protein
MNKISAFFISLLFAFGSLLAQDHVLLNGSVDKKDYSFTIPFEYEQNMIIIRPEIYGKKRKFVIDTGAPTSITHAFAEELNLQTTSKTPIIDAYNHVDSVSMVIMPDIKIADVNFTKIGAIVTSPFFHECIHLDGMIGSNLFQNSVVQFLFKEKIIIISSNVKHHHLKNNLITDLYLGYYKNPYLLIKINSTITDNVLFDTGASEFFTMSGKIFNNFKTDLDTTKIEIGNGACGFGAFGIEEHGEKQRAVLENIIFCGTKFTNVPVIPANTNESRIGVFMLQHGDVTIDYVYSKLYFKPYKQEFNKHKKMWNINPTFYRGKTIVGYVWGETAKEVCFGDEIVSIDKKPVTFSSFCEYFFYTGFYTKKRKHILVIKTVKGELKTINMIKK